jgi:hypothetical protein
MGKKLLISNGLPVFGRPIAAIDPQQTFLLLANLTEED